MAAAYKISMPNEYEWSSVSCEISHCEMTQRSYSLLHCLLLCLKHQRSDLNNFKSHPVQSLKVGFRDIFYAVCATFQNGHTAFFFFVFYSIKRSSGEMVAALCLKYKRMQLLALC